MAESHAPSPDPGDEGPREFVKYSFYHLRPEWRRLPVDERRAGRAQLVRLLESPPEDLVLRTYSTVGTHVGTEFALWMIGPDLARHQELHARIAGTPLGGYLDLAYSYLGMAHRSEYMGEHAISEADGARRRPFDLPYLFVYPFVKKRAWYSLPFKERQRIMGEHFRIGHKYPKVLIHTGYSFGLDDPEFILAFEAEWPGDFLDLVRDLRPSEASRYTEIETPIFTCLKVGPARMLELAEGLP